MAWGKLQREFSFGDLDKQTILCRGFPLRTQRLPHSEHFFLRMGYIFKGKKIPAPTLAHQKDLDLSGFFIFLFFIFVFYKNIFSIWKFTGIYPGRDLAARQRGGMGFCAKTLAQIIARRSLGAGRPAVGRPGPLAARLLGDRLSHPYIRVGWLPTPHLHH